MSQIVEEVRLARRLPSPRMRKQIRVDAGVSQTRMAAELGVDRVTLARWETPGDRTPRGELLEPYSDLLGRLQELIAS
jgi:transcriptional regulator with XRE-family HTH domain